MDKQLQTDMQRQPKDPCETARELNSQGTNTSIGSRTILYKLLNLINFDLGWQRMYMLFIPSFRFTFLLLRSTFYYRTALALLCTASVSHSQDLQMFSHANYLENSIEESMNN